MRRRTGIQGEGESSERRPTSCTDTSCRGIAWLEVVVGSVCIAPPDVPYMLRFGARRRAWVYCSSATHRRPAMDRCAEGRRAPYRDPTPIWKLEAVSCHVRVAGPLDQFRPVWLDSREKRRTREGRSSTWEYSEISHLTVAPCPRVQPCRAPIGFLEAAHHA